LDFEVGGTPPFGLNTTRQLCVAVDDVCREFSGELDMVENITD